MRGSRRERLIYDPCVSVQPGAPKRMSCGENSSPWLLAVFRLLVCVRCVGAGLPRIVRRGRDGVLHRAHKRRRDGSSLVGNFSEAAVPMLGRVAMPLSRTHFGWPGGDLRQLAFDNVAVVAVDGVEALARATRISRDLKSEAMHDPAGELTLRAWFYDVEHAAITECSEDNCEFSTRSMTIRAKLVSA